MANGALDESTLAPLVNFHPIDIRAKGIALPEVARQWGVMAAACAAETGQRLDASEGYRPLATQQYWKTYWTNLGKPGNAAAVGYSTHGEAVSIDVGSGAGTNGTPVEDWLQENCEKYGFKRDVSYELWHLHYTGNPSIIAITQTGNYMASKDAEIIRNTKTGAMALVNIASGMWYPIPNTAYLDLVKARFHQPVQTDYPDNEFKWLKTVARSRA